jgi:undecaprenyl-diphosphatase
MDARPSYLRYLPWLAALALLGLAALLYDAQISAALVCFTRAHPGLERFARLTTDWGDYLFYAAAALAFLVGLRRGDRALIRLGLAYGLTVLLFSLLAGHLIKIAVGRPRPFVGMAAVCRPLSLEAAYNSFPSGHTADAFAAVPPTFRWLRGALLKAAVLLLASAVSLTRVMLGQHYPTDVMAGVALGLGGGLVVCRLLERWLPVGSPGRVP